MDLKKQIFKLLEEEEKERFINKKNQQRFEQQCSHFCNGVMKPVFKNIQQAFMSYRRSVDISPSFFSCVRPGVYPKLCISVPNGRMFRYWVEVKQIRDKFCVKRFRSIEEEGGVPKVFKTSLPHGRQPVDDLSEITEEYLQRDIIELYRRHIIISTIPLRHVE